MSRYHANATGALTAALKKINREVDPEQLTAAARAAKLTVPMQAEYVSAPSIQVDGGNRLSFWIEDADLPKLLAVVDGVMAKPAKSVASRAAG